jgi:RNA polymerase sigma-70 factor (ECF subfamily)
MLVEFELIQRAQGGDSGAFNQIVTAYRRRILGIVARLVSRSEDVEDVGQEVFTRLYFSLGQLRSPDGFDAWMYRMTVNACYDHLRRQRRRPESRMADLSDQQIVSADSAAGLNASLIESEKNAAREQVNTLLGAVSQEDRALLIMKEVEGLSLKELSGVYRVNENALKVRLFRARQRVLKAMGGSKS